MYGSVLPAAVIFITHGIMLYGFEEQKKRMALGPLALMGLLNLVGGFFYATRVSCLSEDPKKEADCYRFLKSGIPLSTTSSVAAIRFSMS